MLFFDSSESRNGTEAIVGKRPERELGIAVNCMEKCARHYLCSPLIEDLHCSHIPDHQA